MKTTPPTPTTEQGIVWLDGELVESTGAQVPVMTHTLHYGVGAFEGIRAYDGDKGPAVFRLREHIERLERSARMILVDMPFSVDELMQACRKTLAANQLRAGYLRPVVFVDDGQRGLGAMNNRTRVAVVTWPWGAYLGEDGLKRGISTKISSYSRIDGRSHLPKGKINGQYVNSILAKREALKAGYDEALLLDGMGNVCEGTGENLFVVRDGVIYTPPRGMPILDGITRASVITLAQEAGYDVIEQAFGRDFLFDADEIFLTGTAAEVTPVRAVDNRQIGPGMRGPITERLQAMYFDAVNGRDGDPRGWLAPYSVD